MRALIVGGTTEAKALAIVKKWANTIEGLPGVVAAWVFGSLARGDFGPGSDIDLQVLIHSSALDALWAGERSELTLPFGPHLLAERREGLHRIVTLSGFVVDIGAETWAGGNQHVTHFTPPMPLFGNVEIVGQERGPDRVEPPTPEQVKKWLAETLAVMLAAPTVRDEPAASRLYNSLYHVELAKLLYVVEGVKWAQEYKHIDKWMSPYSAAQIASLDPYRLYDRMLAAIQHWYRRMDLEWPQAIIDACRTRFLEEMCAP